MANKSIASFKCKDLNVIISKLIPSLLLVFILLISVSRSNAQNPLGITGADPVCEGSLESYSANLVTGNYNWHVINGTGNNSSTNNINILWGNAGIGTIILYITDSSGDTTSVSTIDVVIQSKAEPVITTDFNSGCLIWIPREKHHSVNNQELVPDTCFKACDSSVVNYMVNNTSGSTWQWFVTGAISFTANGNELEVLWGAPGVGWVKVVETTAAGCKDSSEHCVRVIERPQAAFTSQPAAVNGLITICHGQTIYLTDQSVGTTDSPIMNWFWDFGDGYTSTDPNPSHTYQDPGNYEITLIVTNMCNCKDTMVVNVYVDETRAPIIECAGTVCAGDTVQYISRSDCSIFNWVVTGGSVISGGAPNNNFVTVVWGSGTNGVGTVSLATPSCADYCEVPNILQIPIVSTDVNIIGPATVCEWSQVQYQVPVMPGTLYTWYTIGAATVVHGQGTHTVFVNVQDSNFEIYVEFYNAFLECGGADTLVVSVLPAFSIEGPEEGCNGENFTFNSTASPSNNYTWKILKVNTNTVVFGPTNGTGIFNINWTFGHGDFIIYAINSTGLYCNTIESSFLKIHPLPPLPDPAVGEVKICPEQAYEYTAEPTDPNYYIQWQITGGSPASATGNIISVLWDAAGPYQVSVSQVSKNEPYCESDYVDLNIFENTPPSPVSADILGDDEVCTNTISSYSTNLIAHNYTWRILGPNSNLTTYSGSIISGQGTNNISVLWHNSPGQAIVRLILKNCESSDSTDYLVDVTGATMPVINAPTSICSGESVNFNQHNITTATSWSWNFGDGTTSNQQYPNHLFTNLTTDPITFNVTFTVTDPDGCVGVYTATQTINIYPQPLAILTFVGKLVYCPMETINTTFYAPQSFNNTTGLSNYFYEWFQNSILINGATNSSYNATTAGTYHVVVTNNYGCTSTSLPRTITVLSSCSPGPSCTSSGETVTLSYTIGPNCTDVTFTASILPGNITPTSITYYSGDIIAGSTNNTYTYPAPGYYNASVVVEFAGYCKEVDDELVHIPIMADFNIELECYDEDEFTVNFIDLSTYLPTAINDWDWEINDGTSSVFINNTQYPSMQLTPGSYTVTLTISNGTDNCSIEKIITVPYPAVAHFTSDSPKCEKTPTMHFTDNSQPQVDIISWNWDFGDNAGSLLQNPDRTYDEGLNIYSVTLTITDKYGCTSTFQDDVTVNKNSIDGQIDPNFLLLCNGTQGMLNFISNNPFSNITSFLWSTGETAATIAVSQTGNYTVTVTDDLGCSFTTPVAVVQVQHIPYPLITGQLNYCEGDTVKLNANQGNMYSYEWLLDGTPVPTPTPPHLLELTGLGDGSHSVEVVISDGTCSNTAQVTVIVNSIPIAPLINFNNDPLCENESVLVSITNNSGLLHNWSTGQSGMSITVNNAGLYAVTVTNSIGCTSSSTFNINPEPNFDWLISGCYKFCDTIPIIIPGTFIPSGPFQEYMEWTWYVNGDPVSSGTGGVDDLDLLQFVSLGTHIIQLHAITFDGCEGLSDLIEITIKQCPCECLSVEFQEPKCYFTDAAGIQYYLWEAQINFDCAENGSFTIYSPNGELVLNSSTNLTGGPNFISGIFKDTGPIGNVMCLNFSVTYPEGMCDFQSCIELPECDSVECEFSIELSDIRCIGLNSSGYYMYNFSFDLNSPNDYDILITSNNGSVVFSPAQLYGGGNTISGTFTNLSGANYFCFYISAYNPETGETCFYEFCIDGLPECECPSSIELCKFICTGSDESTGQPVYYFEVCLISPANQFLYISALNGSIINQSQIQVAQGTSIISGFYIHNGLTNVACFDFIFVHEVNATRVDYLCDLCITLPDCEGIDSCNQTTVTVADFSCTGTDNLGNPVYLVNFNISSPPLGSLAYITSSTGNIGNINSSGTTAIYSYTNPGAVACFTFYFISPSTPPYVCMVTVCDTLPNCCMSIPAEDSCQVSENPEWTYCLGTDSYGNRIYMFKASVSTSVNYFIYPYTAQGDVYIPQIQLNTGNNQISGIFVDTPPFDTDLTLTVNTLNPLSLTKCYFNLVFDPLDLCEGEGSAERVSYKIPSGSSDFMLRLIPNPASETTSINYKFGKEIKNRIFIMDLQGRIIHTFENLGTEGALNLNTAELPNGIYFVVAQSEKNHKLAEKLEIIR